MPSLSVKARIAATSVALLAVSLTVVAVVVTRSTSASAQRAAERVTSETAARFADQTKAELDEAFSTARDLRSTLTGLRATGGTRGQADQVGRTLLEQHPAYLGVWSGWEPDAFDGQDRQHTADVMSDRSGRYVTYWYRDGAALASSPLVDYGTPGPGDYYQVPSTTRKDKILDPYEYEVAGKQVLMTSVAAPVQADGRVVGVTGVDIALSELQAAVAAVQVYGTGSATLVSSSGVVVAAPDGAAVGKPVDEGVAELVTAAAGGLRRGTATTAAGDVLRVAAPIPLSDQDTWTLVVDVPQSAVTADARALRNRILVVAGLSLLVAAGLALAAARRLVRPVDVLQQRMTEISEGDGDLTQRVDESRDDEIGALGRAFNRFAEKVAGTVREITSTSQELGTAATSLQEVATRLESGAAATSAETAALTTASAKVDASVQSLAAGAEEMGVTAREIAQNASRAAQMASTSVSAAASATSTISSLVMSSAEIGDVVKVIMGIASQTNLLALNATIEAARAGESGKGFAVVAGEVKDLAQETSRASEDIVTRVEAIQAAAVQAGEALDRISSAIATVDEEQTAIAAAVEQQAATAELMAQAITSVADGTTRTSNGISDVDRTALLTSQAASDTTGAAHGLQGTADRLKVLVGDFRC